MTKWKGEVASYAPNVAEITARLAGGALAFSLASVLTMGTATAADRYWDPNGTAVGRGGTGAWNLSGAFWSPSGDGVSGPYSAWNNGALDTATFGGATAGTVTLGGPITVGGMRFETAGYVFNGSTLTLGGATPTITTNAGTTTINSILAGTNGLTKAGGGVLSLTGGNSFSGNINVLGGTLSVNGTTALGAVGNGVTLAAGAGLSSSGSLAGRTITVTGGQASISGAGVGAAHFTGAGGLRAAGTVTLDDDTNDYAGQTSLAGGGSLVFSSIGNIGEASALGAPVDAASGTISLGVGSSSSAYAVYTGGGASSNRDWRLGSWFYESSTISNQGTGTLTLTGDIASVHTNSSVSVRNIIFDARNADIELLGTISSNNAGVGVLFGGNAGRTITVNGANTFGGVASIQGATVKANSLKDTGVASALGTGTNGGIGINNGVLSYVGTGDSSNRDFAVANNSTLANDSTGALALSGDVLLSGAASTLTLGGAFAGTSTLSGIVSGAGSLRSDGAGTWVVSGANTFTGNIVVDSGTLRAGHAQAFGSAKTATVNGGTLDLGGFDQTFTSLSGTGGSIALGGAEMTVKGTASSTFGGAITGNGDLLKQGTGSLTLTGASTFTGDTTINGGAISLDFANAAAPADNILSATSTLNLAGGVLNVSGAGGEANNQTVNGLNVIAGSNKINALSGVGGSLTLNLGGVTRTGGIVDFSMNAGTTITTSNAALGGWATVNGTDYAKVVGNVITAFDTSDYTDKDNAADWLTGEVISDAGAAPDTAFYGTVTGSQQLGGLKYTAAASATVSVAAGQTLGVDGTIIVADSVGTANQRITGGQLTGAASGVLGLQQNGGGTFTIESTIVDNGGATGFTKAGTGYALVSGANTYTGATTLSGGTLAINSVANAGTASAIGQAGVDASNLVIESGTLRYIGATASTDRGFTLVNGGPSRTIEVALAATDVTFSGLVTSPDGSGFTKTGDGTLTLANAANDYTGVTTVNGGTLSVNTLANGGVASGIGAASSDSANLVLGAGGRLRYTGGTVDIDRGFTINGASGRVDVSAAATTLTVGGTVVGVGGLNKEGDGTLVLSGANTYTGGTLVSGGTLRAGSAQAFGSVNMMTVDTGARLELGGYDTTVGGLLGDGVVDLGGNTLTSSGLSANGFAGRITGTGGFTRSGSWTQTLSGCNNDYTGKTTVTGSGTLSIDCIANGGQASGIGASSNASANLVLTGGLLNYTGSTVTTDRGFTLAGGAGAIGVTDAATTLTFTGQAVGGGYLRKDGAGTLVLTAANTYAGGTQVTGGILRAGSTSAFGSGSMNLFNNAGATLDLNGFDTSVSILVGGGTTGGNVELGGATLTISAGNSSNTSHYAGAISGIGSLVKNGTGIQRLTGCDSSYSGSTTVNGGYLDVACLNDGGVASSIGMSSADASNLVINGGALRYIGSGGSTDRRFTLGASGGNSLESWGTGAINFTSSAAVTFAAANTAQTLTLAGTNTGDNKLGAQLTNNGTGVTSLTKSGTGTWILTNPGSTYTGVTKIDGGVLGVDKLADGGLASSLGASSAAASNLIIGNGSTLRYTGSGDTTNRLFTLSAGVTFIESSGTGAIVFTDTGPVTLAGANQNRTIALGGTNTGNNTLAGSIGDAGTGKTILAKNDSGTWVLTGNNSFTGNTVVNDGILSIGNGGTTGSIVSDVIVTGMGALGFNRSDALNYDGLISGTGIVGQIGSGTTTLTGNNTYTGYTTVNAGTLLVNGDQSAATGQTTVSSGGTLGGTGTIGGDVVVADGVLSPGSNGAGTLTINGDLILSGGSILAMQFGEAGTTGGTLNDLITVKGDLTLDGTLDVSETAGGSFGPGIYRIVSYTGNLTDNGLEIGTLPSGTGAIQTSVTGQVNLLAGGDNFSFWDGDAGPKFNGVVNGGNGTWQASPGNNNWTEANGLLNAGYSDGAFAIFAGAAGTVTIDNSLGAVSASGMQFAKSGYVITGNPLTLVGPQSTIRVGDGTAAGAGMTATIASNLGGTSQLVKTDLGTLVLTGTNSYTGGTAINGGTLRIASDANLGAAGGDISFNGGTLNTTATFTSTRDVILAGAGTVSMNNVTSWTLAGDITGAGSLTKAGAAGVLILTGDTTHTGGTTITGGGALQIGNGGTTGSIAGDILNNANLYFNRSDSYTYDGVISGSGQVTHFGAGVLSLTASSSWGGNASVQNGELRIASGNAVSSGGNTTITQGGALTVSGAGSAFETDFVLVRGGTGAPSAINVENGGVLRTTIAGLTLRSGPPAPAMAANLNISGAGSLVDLAGVLSVAIDSGSTANVTISGGGTLRSIGANLIGAAAGNATPSTVTITGAGSNWTSTGTLAMTNGAFSLLDGGAANFASANIGSVAAGASVLVSGANSAFTTSGDLTLGTAAGSGIMTLADTGRLSVGGALTLTNGALNIGGAEGQAAVAAGVLDATSMTVAAGSRVNLNHTDAGYIFSPAISGLGTVNHNGPGATVLTGANSYAGATTINAGGLYVNGNQTAAIGLTSVNTGGTLGGTGTIGGDVVVGSGATINPGDLGIVPGTLTINGDLTLGSGSTQNFSFGQANVPGGPLNDLINVGGNLTLGGTLNVDVSAGGTMDPGVYRVFNYAGTLTDNSWTANLPSPDFYVQTSIDHQVNLVNTAGLALRYWDGDAGPKNNNAIDGGDGTWQAFGTAPDYGNDNWTEDGAVNAPFQDAAFAVFAGASGTVTVDGGKGAINVSGMQFITDGYTVTGDAINLVGASETVIRVGDGTTGGAGTTATIASALTGSSQLVKSDMGTLVLTGNNSYTGGTMIRGGVLQVSADVNLGGALGGVSFNGGTLQTTADLSTSRYVALVGDGTLLTDTGTTLTLDGPVSGGGRLTKDGAGTLILRTDAVHGGGTTITGGTLQLGNGGTVGGVIGDIVNNGVLVTNRSDRLDIAGAISGSGAFTQAGTGTTVLAGLNSYTGATKVDAGKLLVNGDQSAATGATSVATGAALGGAGIIGGNVSIADGGVLEPGSEAGVVGTLTIKGNLGLVAGSSLNMQFGAANVAGGTLNDLIEVEGDLALDGTLNVSETAGGAFGAGIYRVINYDGTLTDNGLTLGSMPADSDVFLQTSVANQINLVNGAGLTLNYWDGDAGPKFDHNIAGGDGIWLNKPGNDNWTDAAGAINAPYTNGSFAIFTGAAGTVTVDNSQGQVAATGMQFAVDGYRIEGEALELTGAQATIRVGDGTTAGVAMTTTIAAELTGTSQLVKGDAGTLILTGVNSYGGGTLMAGGILQVAADTALGATSGGLSFDGGALQTTANMTSDRAVTFTGDGTFLTDAATSLTLNGALSGASAFHKAGDGTLMLTANSSAYGGAASIDAGTLVANGTLGGTLDVSAGGRLEGIGKVGATTNSGVIAAGQGGVGTLTIKGDYTGDDGRIEIVTVLGDDSSETSRLVIDGATSGTSLVGVTNRGGLGAQTVEGIKIIDVTGASNGSFTLDGDYLFEGEQAVVAGAYGYRLYKGGASTPGDGDWYLRSALLDPVDPTDPLYQPGVPIYESYAAAMQQLSKLGTMQQRIGNRQWAAPVDGVRGDAKQDRLAGKNGIWARIEAAHAEFEPAESTSRATYDTSVWKLQAGVDGLLAENDAGRFVGGVFVQYGTVSSNVRSPYGIGGIDTTGYSLGATLTWYGESGFYADAQAQVTWFDSDLNSATAGTRLVSDNSGVGYGLSIEAGQRIALDGAWSLTPQVQLAYSSVSFDDFTDSFGADVSLDHSQSLVGRFGIAANHDIEWRGANGQINRSHLYGIANIYYEFAGRSRVTVSDVSFASRNDRLYGGLGIGGSFNWADDKYTIYGEAQVNTSLENMGDNGAIGGTVGFRMRW